jgi:hypothetical protein
LVERGDNWSSLNIAQVLKISKLVACFIKRIENHILNGSYPDTVPVFTPRDANPNHMSTAAAYFSKRISTECVSTAEKAKSNVSPPSTLACDMQNKKQKLTPGAGLKDFTKAGLFHCKEGTLVYELLPADFIKKSAVSFASITRSVPASSVLRIWAYQQVGQVPPEDQIKILKHCHASKGKKVWLDADIFAKHNITIPKKFAYLHVVLKVCNRFARQWRACGHFPRAFYLAFTFNSYMHASTSHMT